MITHFFPFFFPFIMLINAMCKLRRTVIGDTYFFMEMIDPTKPKELYGKTIYAMISTDIIVEFAYNSVGL